MNNKSVEPGEARYLEVLRNLSPQRKLDMVFEMWETAIELRSISVRLRFPDLDEEGVKEKVVEEFIARH